MYVENCYLPGEKLYLFSFCQKLDTCKSYNEISLWTPSGKYPWPWSWNMYHVGIKIILLNPSEASQHKECLHMWRFWWLTVRFLQQIYSFLNTNTISLGSLFSFQSWLCIVWSSLAWLSSGTSPRSCFSRNQQWHMIERGDSYCHC